MIVAIYGRVSTKDKQEVDNQLQQLNEYCKKNGYKIYRKYIDHMSGSSSERPEFKQLFIDAHQKKFDIVLFWALDRFSREGARETINHLAILESYGAGFISFTEPYLNSIGIFKDAIIGILATLAKQEKVRIQERVRAGLETARRKGKKLGRRGLAPIERRNIIEANELEPKLSIRKLAAKLKVNYGSVNKTLSLYRSGECDKEGFLCD